MFRKSHQVWTFYLAAFGNGRRKTCWGGGAKRSPARNRVNVRVSHFLFSGLNLDTLQYFALEYASNAQTKIELKFLSLAAPQLFHRRPNGNFWMLTYATLLRMVQHPPIPVKASCTLCNKPVWTFDVTALTRCRQRSCVALGRNRKSGVMHLAISGVYGKQRTPIKRVSRTNGRNVHIEHTFHLATNEHASP